MHAFRLIRERFPHVRAASQPHSDLLCLSDATMVQGFPLARIGQAVAAPACEQFTGNVQHCDAAPAVSTIGVNGTDKPGAMTARVARGPGDRDALLYRLPFGVSPASRAVHQNHGVCFSAHLNAAGRLSAAGPRPREMLPGVQPPLAMPPAHIDRDAGLTGYAATTVRPAHLLASPSPAPRARDHRLCRRRRATRA